ncbi:hypothetical protein HGRIS_000742 [Hohenbuehelia grisea]|uniref:TIGR04076 family protein n=1 Tax=Hohenbuehelia grisea TaxID=104357 RepID=A0ABR3IPL8_9AGAR
MASQYNDSFELYDLRVEAVCPPNARILCGAKDGDYFTLEGEMLHLPPGQGILIDIFFDPGSLLPLLPAKQRPTHPNDWMTTDALIACPDPHCASRWRIIRTQLRTFSHANVTAVPIFTPNATPVVGLEA